MKPLVIAHRGASAYAPENTLAAFNLALEMGADGIELDARLTKDGVPVVRHDTIVDSTTNGHGAINQLTLAEIKQLDVNVQPDKQQGEKIPTLEESLRAVGMRGIVNIEIKSGKPRPVGLAVAVVQVIAKTQMANRITVSSFDRGLLHQVARLNPDLPRGLLYARGLPISVCHASSRPIVSYTALHPRYPTVTPEFVTWARYNGYKINAWTVDDPDEMKRLIALGVDAILTNKPDALRAIVG
jgi:glycerophosphoryl diester phosphodiesterase